MNPRTVEQRVVLLLEGEVLLEQRLDLVSVIVRAETSLRSAQVVDASGDPHVRKSESREDRVVDQLEERGLLVRRERVVDTRGERREALQVRNNSLGPDIRNQRGDRLEER